MKRYLIFLLLLAGCHKDNTVSPVNTGVSNSQSQQITISIVNCENMVCDWYIPGYVYKVGTVTTSGGFNIFPNPVIYDTTITLPAGDSVECFSQAGGHWPLYGNGDAILSMTVNGITYKDSCHVPDSNEYLTISYKVIK